MNTAKEWLTVAKVHNPERKAFWESIFGSDMVPVKLRGLLATLLAIERRLSVKRRRLLATQKKVPVKLRALLAIEKGLPVNFRGLLATLLAL